MTILQGTNPINGSCTEEILIEVIMTQQNIQNEIESDRAIRDRENSESNQDATDRDHRVANPPIEAQESSFKEYCAANPSASECKVYDL